MSVNRTSHGGRRLPRRQQIFDPYEVTAIFENPATGWRESVPRRAWLWMFLFGLFYMAARNLWRPFTFVLVVLIGTLLVAWPLIFIVAPGFSILAAVQAQRMFREHYMRLGWDEIDPWHQEDEHADALA